MQLGQLNNDLAHASVAHGMRSVFKYALPPLCARAAITLSTAFFCVLIGNAAQAAGLDPGEVARVAKGEAIARVDPADGDADGLVIAAVDIAAPPAKVWHVLVDCAHAAVVMPNLTACDVVQTGRGGQWDIREHRIRWISLMPEIRSQFRSDYEVGRSIRFQRTGGDMRALEGSWRLEPLQGGAATRLHYEARVGFGALIPGFVIRNALAKDVPGFLNAIRTEAVRLPEPRAAAR